MITSNNNAKVKQVVQWQTKAKERRKDHVFLAEGIRMCEEAPVKNVREVYLTEELEQKIRQNAQNGDTAFWDKLQQTGYETVSPEVFAKMADTQTPQGILTVLEQPVYDLIQLLEQPDPLFLMLENLQDPGNLGTMIRTGEGAGITGVIMNNQTVDIFNPKTIRATMGSIFRVPFVYVQIWPPGAGTDACKRYPHLCGTLERTGILRFLFFPGSLRRSSSATKETAYPRKSPTRRDSISRSPWRAGWNP